MPRSSLPTDSMDARAATAHGIEYRSVCLIFQNPGLGKGAILNFRQDFFHFRPGLVGDDAGTAHIVAEFGRIADGITHAAIPPSYIRSTISFISCMHSK